MLLRKQAINDALFFHLTQLVLLHYLGKEETWKLRLFT